MGNPPTADRSSAGEDDARVRLDAIDGGTGRRHKGKVLWGERACTDSRRSLIDNRQSSIYFWFSCFSRRPFASMVGGWFHSIWSERV